MGFLKGLAASAISLVIFVSLSFFGMAFTINQTVLNPSLLIRETDRLDLPALVDQTLTDQIAKQIPGQEALVRSVIKKTSTDLQPWAKEQASFIINSFEFYMKGQTSSLNVVISLDPVKKTLGDNVRQAVAQSPSLQIPGVPPAAVSQYITDQIVGQLPATITINESSDGVSAITQVRPYTSKIMLIMVGLVLLMLVLIGLLFLLNRNVKQTARDLGVTFLMSGVIDYALAFLGDKFSPNLLDQMGGMPDALRAWLPQVITEWTQPVLTFGLTVAIVGAALIVFSLVYKRKPKESMA